MSEYYGMQRRFSSWTPLHNKQHNAQLFEERLNLVLHWFQMWTEPQRKLLLNRLINNCNRTQLRFCRELLIQKAPVTQADFTAVLPRFLSLYVFSFLTPRDLCRASQVSWHWRVLAEQDCLWAGRCIRKGWFLPYAPGPRESGAWKNHYISCVSTLDWLTPLEVVQRYGTITPREEEEEEEEERRRKMRDIIHHMKRESMRTRTVWGSWTRTDQVPCGVPSQIPSSRTQRSSAVGQSLDGGWSRTGTQSLDGGRSRTGTQRTQSLDGGRSRTGTQSLETVQTSDGLSRLGGVPSSSSGHLSRPRLHTPPALLLLVSTSIPAYEVVLSSVRADVAAVLYDHRGSLSALLARAERVVGRQRSVQRIGLLAPGGTQEVTILHRSVLSEKTLLNPDHKEFWEKLSQLVEPGEEGRGVDIFCPLAASAAGVSVMNALSALTDLEVLAPMGFATGSFQNILSEWSDSRVHAGLPAAPALRYLDGVVLRAWCRQAQWMEKVLERLRSTVGLELQRESLQTRGRTLGFFLWDKLRLADLTIPRILGEALTEGLNAVSRQDEIPPLEFLSTFLKEWPEKKKKTMTPTEEEECGRPQTVLDWRGAVITELHHSERLYLDRLSSIQKVYQEPLTATLECNRAILSFTEIQIVFVPVARILELNRSFEANLRVRLSHWGADQCVGDVLEKLCSNLRVYSNYLNNFPTAISTIDKCRESKPAFRSFLKQVDRTLPTHTMTLQELLISPLWRIDQYVTLLQALSLHTSQNHPDHCDIRSSLQTLLAFREFVQKLKLNSEGDELMDEAQKMIHNCPTLREGTRHLLLCQDAALLKSSSEILPESLRSFQEVADVTLFLFSDAVVLTRRLVRHAPFTLTPRSEHVFDSSLALSSISVREIKHCQSGCEPFVVDGPSSSWVCSIEAEEEKENFLNVLQSAITSALTGR